MTTASLLNGTLLLDDVPLISGMADTLQVETDPLGVGAFVRFQPKVGNQRQEILLGQIIEMERFTACHRYEPFWMKPCAGAATSEIPGETQSLLVRRSDGRVMIVIALCDGVLRSSVESNGDRLQLVVETGAVNIPAAAAVALFIALTDDIYECLPKAAAAISSHLGTGELRRDKPLPDYIDQFGWCTWDAFYQDVSEPKVREGLESFKRIGLIPSLVILDDGWQCEATMATGERRLNGLTANAKFGGGLKSTVDMVKNEFGVQTFMVWHAMLGYWGGVDGTALPAYDVRTVAKRSSLGVTRHCPTLQEWFGGHAMGVIDESKAGLFYDDYHRWLAAEGVDGVKVDVQGMLETVADGSSGRVQMTQAFRRGLETSVEKHFSDRLINCMSCATETWYQSPRSNMIRTSTDFWPNKPDSHGLHLYTNAQVCVWFSEFIHADWDMFQSGHAMGAYHAAARAVSGSPIYVSDKPDQHSAEILRKLVIHDGTILRCLDIGRPTVDCLFRDPTREAVLLKIFNRNQFGWVVGAFNARYHADERQRMAIAGKVSPSDVPGIEGDDFVGYGHQSGLLMRMPKKGRVSLTLGELSFEVVSLAPVQHGCAVIGLADRYNALGAISALTHTATESQMSVRAGGRLLLWCAAKPKSVTVDGAGVPVTFDAETGALTIALTEGAAHQVVVTR